MRQTEKICSVESKAVLRKKHIERFVQENLPPRTSKQSRISSMGGFSERYAEVECCAAESPVIGTVEIMVDSGELFNTIKCISVPVSSRFFVFCTRDMKDDYRVTCCHSLS
jgi:hypothetical protein